MVDTPNFLLTEIVANQNQKEVTMNEALNELDTALGSVATWNVSGGTLTMTQEDILSGFVHVFTNAGATTTINLPQCSRVMVLHNTSSQTLDYTRGTTTISITTGNINWFYTDGTANGLVQIT